MHAQNIKRSYNRLHQVFVCWAMLFVNLFDYLLCLCLQFVFHDSLQLLHNLPPFESAISEFGALNWAAILLVVGGDKSVATGSLDDITSGSLAGMAVHMLETVAGRTLLSLDRRWLEGTGIMSSVMAGCETWVVAKQSSSCSAIVALDAESRQAGCSLWCTVCSDFLVAEIPETVNFWVLFSPALGKMNNEEESEDLKRTNKKLSDLND